MLSCRESRPLASGRRQSEETKSLTGTIDRFYSGPTDTAIFRDGEEKGLFDSKAISAGTLLGRMGHAPEVAKVLCFLLSDDASFVTGGKWIFWNLSFLANLSKTKAHWTVDGGYSAC